GVVDRGGFWANVETWHRDGEHWSTLFQRGMRVMVMGNLVQDQWEQGGEQRTAMKVVANRIGILPYRVGQVTMQPSKGQQQAGQGQSIGEGTPPAYEGQGQHGGM
ncbi:single-stranded DNA-binding protein, partial [Halomonas sp. THAF12]|uniref:single-stranded DNA-binding protein n=1 Tax=Halomonas sp. B23F22_10 TaxID=3459515 RepID=UPI00373EFA91